VVSVLFIHYAEGNIVAGVACNIINLYSFSQPTNVIGTSHSFFEPLVRASLGLESEERDIQDQLVAIFSFLVSIGVDIYDSFGDGIHFLIFWILMDLGIYR
jgi:hypothetical protein